MLRVRNKPPGEKILCLVHLEISARVNRRSRLSAITVYDILITADAARKFLISFLVTRDCFTVLSEQQWNRLCSQPAIDEEKVRGIDFITLECTMSICYLSNFHDEPRAYEVTRPFGKEYRRVDKIGRQLKRKQMKSIVIGVKLLDAIFILLGPTRHTLFQSVMCYFRRYRYAECGKFVRIAALLIDSIDTTAFFSVCAFN